MADTKKNNTLFCFLYILFIYASQLMADSQDYSTPWQQLTRKMTESQVDSLLGSPKETETVGRNLIWYYQDTPRQRDNVVVWRPKAGFVHFKQVTIDGQNTHLLSGWKPPHIDKTQTLPPPAEDTILPDNPLSQLEQIEQMYMEQLHLADPENFNAPTPPQPTPKPQKSAPVSGLNMLAKLFGQIPPHWVLIAIGIICAISTLVILRPRRKQRKRYDFTRQ